MLNIILLFLIIIATYFNVFICNSDFLSENLFKKINILQITTPVLNISLTIYIAYLINIKLAKKNKSNEIFISLLERYEDDINLIQVKAMNYIRDKNNNEAHDIKWLLKTLNIKLSRLEEFYKLYDKSFIYSINDMKKELLELKQSITNDPFMQDATYTATKKTQIIQNFEKIKININKEKINLYK